MTETEATYKLEHEEWAGDPPQAVEPDGEILPECETGSVEQMLEAAIAWSEKFSYQAIEDEHRLNYPLVRADLGVKLRSQEQLLRKILAKMRESTAPDLKEGRCDCDEHHGAQRISTCPNCGAWVRVILEFSKTTSANDT